MKVAPQGSMSLLTKQITEGAIMSFRKTLSDFWGNVHLVLFPMLENHLGELSADHKKLAAILELIRIEEWVPSTCWNRGRTRKDRSRIARALVAKIVFKIPYINKLIYTLKNDVQLRKLCGWDSWSKLPSESKFSRAMKEFAEYQLPEKVHQALIKEVYKNQIVGHVVKDSTSIEVREKSIKKKRTKTHNQMKDERKKAKRAGVLNRRQKQLKESNLNKMIDELPKICDKGAKRNSQGFMISWKGYKLHTAIDDHCIPLAAIVTSASLNDCEVAIPLALKTNQHVVNFYDLMDAAYDHPEIREHSISLGHVPLIDKCPQTSLQKSLKEEEIERKRILNFKTAEDKRYKERLPKERFNALYKDYNGGRNICFRGHEKVSCHVMFGVLTIAASILISLS